MPRKKKEDSSTAVSKSSVPKKKNAPKKAKAPKIPAKKSARKSVPKASKALKVKAPLAAVSKTSKETASPAVSPVKNGRLPRQGQTQMVVFIRDPHCLFTYWEIAKEVLDAAQAKLGPEFGASTRILKISGKVPAGKRFP